MKTSRIVLSFMFAIWAPLQAMELPIPSGVEFLEAVKKNDLGTVEKYLDRRADVNFQDELGNTALHYAYGLGAAGEQMVNLLKTKRAGQLQELKNKEGKLPAEMAPAGGYFSGVGSYLMAPVSGAQWGAGKLWEYTSGAAQVAGGAAQTAGEYAVAGAKTAYACAATSLEMSMAIEQPDAHSAEPASLAATISEQEKDFIKNRSPQSKAALEKFLGSSIAANHVPSIGFCFSGGGYRAMLEALGWLTGAEKLGIMDTASYMTGLSGSTWALNPLVASGLSLENYKKQLLPRLTKTKQEHLNTMKDEDFKDILIMLGRKLYKNESIRAVDLFGAFLAHMLLGKQGAAVPNNLVENPYIYPLSSVAPAVGKGQFPLPVSTAVLGGEIPEGEVRPTIEFSPFTAGGHEFKASIPTWSFGRVFNKGVSQQIVPTDPFVILAQAATGLFSVASTTATGISTLGSYLWGQKAPETQKAPEAAAVQKSPEVQKKAPKRPAKPGQEEPPFYGTELPLGYLMGIFGSAFTVDMHNILLELSKKLVPVEECPQSALSALKKSLGSYLTKLTEAVALVKPESSKDLEEYLKNQHYGAAWAHNFLYNSANNPFANREQLSFIDGGFSLVNHNRLNIAIVPLLHRRLDVITICDSSWDLAGAPSLKAAERAARVLNLPFPKIDYANIDSTIASIHYDKNNDESPIIVYMPGIANKEYNKDFDPVTSEFTDTFNFTYTPEQAQLLMGLLEKNVEQSKEKLKEAFELAVERKKRVAAKKAGMLGALASWFKSTPKSII